MSESDDPIFTVALRFSLVFTENSKVFKAIFKGNYLTRSCQFTIGAFPIRGAKFQIRTTNMRPAGATRLTDYNFPYGANPISCGAVGANAEHLIAAAVAFVEDFIRGGVGFPRGVSLRHENAKFYHPVYKFSLIRAHSAFKQRTHVKCHGLKEFEKPIQENKFGNLIYL